ncbi:MAG: hypothetical protein M3Y55_03260, partial [Pseudomonadota bacterium]|nr:hypothetical protein [Pseudomonadota bacterium]
AATLCRLLNCRSFEFLRVALEVQQLRALMAPSGASSVNEVDWFDKAWVNAESKSRLMSIFLSVLAVLVTLLATNATVQDEFFEAITNAGVWQLIGVLEFVVLFLTSVLWGARRLWRAGGNLLTRWTLKVSNSGWATRAC